MARGITESVVHNAADELVAKGERPTVERIRAHLGTGSPNTVTRWLETWWQSLGPRLEGHALQLAMPEAPEAVAAMAGQWWSLAVASGRQLAEQALVRDHAALEAERTKLEHGHAALMVRGQELEAELGAARQSEQLALAQATELRRMVDQLDGQLKETIQQREKALARSDQALESARALQQQVQQHMTERGRLTQHVHAVEDRAHQEVDRVRQELKELQSQLATLRKQNGSTEAQLRRQVEESKTVASEAHRAASSERARADALEKQLANLQNLPAALEAVVRKSRTASTKKRK